MNSIIRMCKKYGYKPTIFTMTTGAEAVELNFNMTDRLGIYDFEEALTRAHKIRTNPHIEYNPYCGSIHIIPAAAYEELKKRNNDRSALIEIFWDALHEGKTQEEAKTLQLEYVEAHDAMSAYNSIYA